jgi:hypothetical protein
MSPIVDALEDSDPTVRECARESAVTLFSAPGVSDVARTDLKEQMAKKHVRKTIVDQILAGLMGSSSSAVSSVGDQSDTDRAPRAPSRMLSRNPSVQDSLQRFSQSEIETPTSECFGAGPSAMSDIPIVYVSSKGKFGLWRSTALNFPSDRFSARSRTRIRANDTTL